MITIAAGPVFERYRPLILTRRKRSLSGSAALMLVLVLAMLVGTFAVSVTRRASNERRSEIQHRAVDILESAIEAVAESDFSSQTKVRLPIDDESGRWVIVETVVETDATPKYRATLYHKNLPGISISRVARNES